MSRKFARISGSIMSASNPGQPYDQKPDDPLSKMVEGNNRQNKELVKKFSKGSIPESKASEPCDAEAPKRATNVGWIRFVICTLGVASLAMSQMNRMVVNITITSMVDPSMLKPKGSVSDDDSCPWSEVLIEELGTTEALLESNFETTTVILKTGSNDFESDPIFHYLTQTPENFENQEIKSSTTGGSTTDYDGLSTTTQTPEIISNITSSESGRFKWTMQQQSYLLGGFFWSYFIFMILGGWLAETYGAKYIILVAVLGSAIISLATPWMAKTSLTLLVAARILMGAIQSGVFPAMYAVISRWLTMGEASIFAPMIKMNLRLGMLLASALPGIINGWANVFYVTGSLSFLWSVLWFFLATSTPEDNRWVSKAELEHIMRKKRKPIERQSEEVEMGEISDGKEQKKEKKSKPKTPWLKIIAHPSVIGLIIVKYTFNTGADFLAIELASYLNYVHHVSTQKISAITSFMFGIQVSLVVFVGWIAKIMVKKRPYDLSKTTIRKIFQCFSNFGVGGCLLLITLTNCNLNYVIILLQMYSFLSMFTAGGETMLPYDLSDQYPATIMAIANSVANLSGLTVTSAAGVILGDRGGSQDRWNLLMCLIAGANIFGGIAFVTLVKAEPIDFEAKKKQNSIGTDVEAATSTEMDQPTTLPKTETDAANQTESKPPMKNV